MKIELGGGGEGNDNGVFVVVDKIQSFSPTNSIHANNPIRIKQRPTPHPRRVPSFPLSFPSSVSSLSSQAPY